MLQGTRLWDVPSMAVNYEPPNKRIKLTARGTLTHGKKRQRSHAAAYPHR